MFDPWHIVKHFILFYFILNLSDAKNYENVKLFFINYFSISRDKGTTKKKHKTCGNHIM
jgi:hypothetical protein